MEFFRDIIETMGFEMATCGVLYGGKRFWAQANIGQSVSILGVDRVDGKLLLSTSCDGSLATQAQYTTQRVVCNNTLRAALGNQADYVRVTHATQFNPESIKQILELRPSGLQDWAKLAECMARYQLNAKQAGDFFDMVFNGRLELTDAQAEVSSIAVENPEMLPAVATAQAEPVDRGNTKAIELCLDLFNGRGTGINLESANGTLWGAVNCITEWSDHCRPTKTLDSRIDRAWFGDSGKIKDRAWEEAILLAA